MPDGADSTRETFGAPPHFLPSAAVCASAFAASGGHAGSLGSLHPKLLRPGLRLEDVKLLWSVSSAQMVSRHHTWPAAYFYLQNNRALPQ